MPNPWLKKNPFMSLWLSAAHRTAGAARGQAAAAAKRQVRAVTAETMNEGLKIWTEALFPRVAKKRAVRKR